MGDFSAKFWREEEVFNDDIFTNLTWWLKDGSRHALSVNFAAVTKRTITLRWISQYLRTYLWKGWEGSLKIFHKRSPFRWVFVFVVYERIFFFFFLIFHFGMISHYPSSRISLTSGVHCPFHKSILQVILSPSLPLFQHFNSLHFNNLIKYLCPICHSNRFYTLLMSATAARLSMPHWFYKYITTETLPFCTWPSISRCCLGGYSNSKSEYLWRQLNLAAATATTTLHQSHRIVNLHAAL